MDEMNAEQAMNTALKLHEMSNADLINGLEAIAQGFGKDILSQMMAMTIAEAIERIRK